MNNNPLLDGLKHERLASKAKGYKALTRNRLKLVMITAMNEVHGPDSNGSNKKVSTIAENQVSGPDSNLPARENL